MLESEQQQVSLEIILGSSSFKSFLHRKTAVHLYPVCVSCMLLHIHHVYNHDYFPRLGQMFHCYSKCKEIGAIAQVHAENGTLIAEVKYCSYTCTCKYV